jgi:hypothetical protein
VSGRAKGLSNIEENTNKNINEPVGKQLGSKQKAI